jgi:hypothetical protein
VTEVARRPGEDAPDREVALVDLLDRLLGAGVVLSGDVVISLAGIDLVEVRLHALVTSVRAGSDRDRPGDDVVWTVESREHRHG